MSKACIIKEINMDCPSQFQGDGFCRSFITTADTTGFGSRVFAGAAVYVSAADRDLEPEEKQQ